MCFADKKRKDPPHRLLKYRYIDKTWIRFASLQPSGQTPPSKLLKHIISNILMWNTTLHLVRVPSIVGRYDVPYVELKGRLKRETQIQYLKYLPVSLPSDNPTSFIFTRSHVAGLKQTNIPVVSRKKRMSTECAELVKCKTCLTSPRQRCWDWPPGRRLLVLTNQRHWEGWR